MGRQHHSESRDARALLASARRIVIKLGSGVVCDDNHHFDQEHLAGLVASIVALVKAGRQVVLVSSGAITLGAAALNVHRSRLRDAGITRACAAAGQCRLMEAYAQAFRPHHLNIAQVLVTEDDFTDLNRYKILRQTFEKLLKLGAVPIVNENDTVTNIYTEQPPVFRDNDRLAALVLSKLDADALVLLSNVDGLLRDPEKPASPENLVSLVTDITPVILESASGKSSVGRGGMTAKLEAAEVAMRAGGLVVIANGKRSGVLTRIFSGAPEGTVFQPLSRMAGKRRWLAFATTARGSVAINANATKALHHGHASLLISGVSDCQGEWASGQVIDVFGPEGEKIGRGIAEFASGELARILSGSDGQRRGMLIRRENFLLISGKEAADVRQH